MLFNYIKKFVRVPFKRKIVIIEAFLWLPIMKIIIHFVPTKIYTPIILGELSKLTEEIEIYNKTEIFENMKWGINIVSEIMPWSKKCYAMATTAKIMLKYRGIKSTIYLGLIKKENGMFRAHAWIRAGNFYITGGNGTGYTIVSYFS